MVRRLVCSSSGRATMLLIMSCVGLVFVTTFTDAAPAILSQNQTPVTLLSRLTQLFVTVSADGLVQANGLSSRDST